jgi:hypothetical protein
MTVERYDPYGAYMEQRKDGQFVQYEEFERVFNALRALAHRMRDDATVFAFDEALNDAQQVVDQYE